jgi:ABC-type proline/glycine betaine transport system permease subunit
MDVAVAYDISVRYGCVDSICPHHAITRLWHSHILYATVTAVAVGYNIPVRLRYVAMAYRKFCTPWKTIPPIAIFLVVADCLSAIS